MVTGLLQGLLPTVLVSLSFASTTPSATLHNTSSATVRESRIYVVHEGDTLDSIATSAYGDSAYWTTLWNDNRWLENPNAIEPGWQFTLRDEKPLFVDNLEPDLIKRMDELTKASQSELPMPTPTLSPAPQPSEVATSQLEVAASQQLRVQRSSATGPLTPEQITFLGTCESGMTAARNSGNGYYGAFQFSIGTWNSMGTGYERADLAPLDVQIDAVQRLLTRSSIWTQFPGCAAKMRNAGLI